LTRTACVIDKSQRAATVLACGCGVPGVSTTLLRCWNAAIWTRLQGFTVPAQAVTIASAASPPGLSGSARAAPRTGLALSCPACARSDPALAASFYRALMGSWCCHSRPECFSRWIHARSGGPCPSRGWARSGVALRARAGSPRPSTALTAELDPYLRSRLLWLIWCDR